MSHTGTAGLPGPSLALPGPLKMVGGVRNDRLRSVGVDEWSWDTRSNDTSRRFTYC